MLDTGRELNRCSRRCLISSELGVSDEFSPCAVLFAVPLVATSSSWFCCSVALEENVSAVKERGGSLAMDSLDPVGRVVSGSSEGPAVGDATPAVVGGISFWDGAGYPGKPGPAGKLIGENIKQNVHWLAIQWTFSPHTSVIP